MASAQFLSGSPAALAVSGVGVATTPVSTISANPVSGITVSPASAGSSCFFSEQATLTQAAAGVGVAGDVFRYAQSVGGDALGTGGVLPGRLQMFSYKNGAFEAKLLESGIPNTATESILSINRGALDATRFGYQTLAAGANVINVNSINAGSTVRLRLAGSTAANGFAGAPANAPIPVPVVSAIVPFQQNPFVAGSFTITGLAVHVGMIYDYEVIG